MKKLLSLGIVIGMLFVVAVAVWGAGSEPFASITANALKALIDRNEPTLVIIDSRSNEEYQEAHIRTAISIPLVVQEQNPQVLRFAKNARIVFYCNGFS